MILVSQKTEKAVEWENKKISWQQQLAKELHKPIKRDFTWWRVIVNDVDGLWAQDLVDMQKFS